jgi:hypothetical protein
VRACVRACVRASLAMDSCRTPRTPPLGTRLTTSALASSSFFLFFSVEAEKCVLRIESAYACA